MKRIFRWKMHTVPFHRDSLCKHNALLCTFDGLALGQDGDCSLCHLLLVHNRRDLWAPAVRTHPDKMTGLVGLFSCVKEPPAKVKKQMLPRIRSAFWPALILSGNLLKSWTETAVLPPASVLSSKGCYIAGLTWYRPRWRKVWLLLRLGFLEVAEWPCQTLAAWAHGESWRTVRYTGLLKTQKFIEINVFIQKNCRTRD